MKRIRVQLQEGHLHTHSKKLEAAQEQSISVRQVQLLLEELYHSTKAEAPWYPMNDRIARQRYGHAIAELSRTLNSYPPNGTDQEGNILRKEWQNNVGREFRLDIENFGGSNLQRLRSSEAEEANTKTNKQHNVLADG